MSIEISKSERDGQFMNKLLTFLGKPRTINQQISRRKISWLELFYDLMFSVVIARLTDSLVGHFSLTSLLYSALTFGWFIWGWNEMSGYFDNHGNDSIINILAINTEMILTGIGALFIPNALSGDFSRIGIIWMLIELLMAVIWFGLAHFDRLHGPASRAWGAVHLFAFVVMLITYFIGPQFQKAGLVLGLLLNIFDVFAANPRLSREYHHANLQHEVKDSLIERYGLMTMIALGEIIAGLYETMTENHITGAAIIRFIISMIVIALVAAIYYQVLGTLHIRLRSSIATTMTGWLFIINIMFAFYLGVAFQLLLGGENTSQQLLGNGAFIIALLLFMVTIRAIVVIGTQMSKKRNENKISWLLLTEGIVLLLLILTPTMVVLSGTLVILLIIIIQGRKYLP